ncbi:methyltransferase domain-containing protein [Streptomyces sp. HUCO-GS316]|uniref:class I SAM-dependent methyltransferase n=1 Tax=Streptomyces sp. HUCO-GS316 TaxID=2692198 RepID=UPI0013702FEA|nr:methyltransferase domain-containing protein [Streptomyces sp. HUCO-GS316]
MDSITEITRASYERSAHTYAGATWEYHNFPGLQMDALNFSESLQTTGPILDLGCGGGRDANYFASHGHRVVAADISVQMLREARRRIAPSRESQVDFVCVDIRRLPFQGKTFSGVWASGSLLHVPRADLLPSLRKIAKVLKAGGLAALSMKNGAGEGWEQLGAVSGSRWFTYVDPTDFADLMRQAGFEPVSYQPSSRGTWFLATGYV